MGTSDLLKHLQSRYANPCDDLKSAQVAKEAFKGIAAAHAENPYPSPIENLKSLDMDSSGLPTETVEQPIQTAVICHNRLGDWQKLASEYHVHHFSCKYCIAAGQNPNLQRCTTGLPLWQAYTSACAQST